MTLVDGIESCLINVADRGFQYGDGIFTTLRVLNGKPLFFSRHIDRLHRDSQQLNIELPQDTILQQEIYDLSESSKVGVIKVIITRGIGGRGYLCPVDTKATRVISVFPFPVYPSCFQSEGVNLSLCRVRLGQNELLAGAKHLNRLEQILARQEWLTDKYQEGIMLDQEGFVIEGTMTNVFFATNQSLFTPNLDRCGVRGVMRSVVMSLAQNLSIPVVERRVSLSDITSAEEIFLTNSVIGIWPVRRFADIEYSLGTVTKRLMAAVDDLIYQESN